MLEHFRIRRQQRETLIHDVVLITEFSHLAIPAESGKATVLNEYRHLCTRCLHLLQVFQRNVAEAEQPRAARNSFFPHRLPHLGISLAPPITGRWPVQHELST